ncbi:MAG TPA: hypothetical protein V6D47_06800 [Oscillatoriaceae cyanobacterium]
MPACPPAACAIGFPRDPLRQSLKDRYRALLDAGVPSDRILVLLESRTRSDWNNWLKGLPRPTGAWRIHTPGAWMQREIELWWPAVQAALADRGWECLQPEPRFVAIDLSQYLLAHFAEELRDEEGAYVPGSRSAPRFQGIQILDALGRSIENGARLDASGGLAAEVGRRLMPALAERLDAPALAQRVGRAIALYTNGMLQHGLLDHALTLVLFTEVLWQDAGYQAHLRANTGHLLIESLDETGPRLQTLCRDLQDSGVTLFATLKRDVQAERAVHHFAGGLREYVGADPVGAWEIAGRIPQTVIEETAPPLADLGRSLHDALHGEIRTAKLTAEAIAVKLDDYSPAEMLSALMDDLGPVLERGEPNEVAIVAPSLSPLLIWSLRQRLEALGYPLYVFAGTNRLTDHRSVRLLLTLAKLCHPEWGAPTTRYELLELLETTMGLNPLRLGRMLKGLFDDGLATAEALVAAAPGLDPAHLERYERLLAAIEVLKSAPDLETFFRLAFAKAYVPFRPEDDRLADKEAFQREVSQIGQLIELAGRFRQVDHRLHGEGDPGPRFLRFLAESPIAERPFFQREPHEGAVMLATPSQLAEQGFVEPSETLKHLFLLDAGSELWWKSDRKELTNARVLAHRYAGGPYTLEQDKADQNEKLGRVLMTLCLKVEQKLWVYGCLTDEEGRENAGELPYLLGAVMERARV